MIAAEQTLRDARKLFENGEYQKAHDLYVSLPSQETPNWRDVFYLACCKACICKTSETAARLEAVARLSIDVPPAIFFESGSIEAALPVYLEYYRCWLLINKRRIRFLRSVYRQVRTDEARNLYTDSALNNYAAQLHLADNWLNNPDLKADTNVPSFVAPLVDMVKELYDEMDTVFSDMYDETLPNATNKEWLERMLDIWTNTFLYTKTLGPFLCEREPGYVHSAEKRLKERLQYLAANPKAGKSGGCYVATAIYGSYDCPEVWTLRRYRDFTLAETRYGRAFIRAYYAVSPTLVKWFGHTAWFKAMWQGRLDRMVARLRAEGVESTPYEDRIW